MAFCYMLYRQNCDKKEILQMIESRDRKREAEELQAQQAALNSREAENQEVPTPRAEEKRPIEKDHFPSLTT